VDAGGEERAKDTVGKCMEEWRKRGGVECWGTKIIDEVLKG